MGRRLNLQDPHDITSAMLVLNIVASCLLYGVVIVLRMGSILWELVEDRFNTKKSRLRRANKVDRDMALGAISDLISEPETYAMLTHRQ